MLKNIHIQNYRGIKDLEIKDFKRINLLVGDNDSGKTSVLEAILLGVNYNILPIFDILTVRDVGLGANLSEINLSNYKLWEDLSYLVNERNIKNKIAINIDFSKDRKKIDRSHNLEISFVNEAIEFSNKQATASGIINPNEINSFVAEYKVKNKNIVRLGLSKNQTFDVIKNSEYFITLNAISNRIVKAGELQFDMQEITKNNLEKELVKVLNQIDPQIKNIKNNQNEILCDIGDISIPLKNMGDGLIQVLNILLRLRKTKNGILLIDEIENGLHWKTQQILWREIIDILKKNNVQLFATTHSHEMIEALNEVSEEMGEHKNIALYSLDKKDDKNFVNKYDSKLLDEMIAVGGEIR